MIISTSAIVLRTLDYSESSKIATLLTPDHGKIGVIVKGARKPKSKYAGYFETGNILDVVLYIKPTRSVQNLNEVAFRSKNWNIRQDFTKLAVVLAIIEMLDGLVHEYESANEIYELAETMINWINETSEDMVNVFPYILVRLADSSGFGLQLGEDIHPNNKQSGYLNVEDGSVTNDPGVGLSFKLSDFQFDYLKSAIGTKKSDMFRNGITKNEIKMLIHHLDVYLKHHIEGLRDRRSDLIFEQILQ